MVGVFFAKLHRMIRVIDGAGAVAVGERRRCEAERSVSAAAKRVSERAEVMIERAIFLTQNHHVFDRIVGWPVRLVLLPRGAAPGAG